MSARNKVVVFLAEDDVILRHLLREALIDASFDVVQASDGVQLLALLETNRLTPPDVVITDVDMPTLGGLDVLALMRADGNRQPAIVITGNDAPGVQAQIERLGAVFMRKPLALATLLERVQSLARLQSRDVQRS